MGLGLLFVIKDEAPNLHECLGPIVDLFDQVSVIDTGSTDGSIDILRNDFGLTAATVPMGPDNHWSLTEIRNIGLDSLNTPWILSLDADERVDREALLRVREALPAVGPDGLFCRWMTAIEDEAIEDYKLVLFRNGHRFRGMHHGNIQPSLRHAGLYAEWTDLFAISHYPDRFREQSKAQRYERVFQNAAKHEPHWLRHKWFRGYQAYREGDYGYAGTLLSVLHEQRPTLFPVESLNASMILAAMAAAQGDGEGGSAIVSEAIRYFENCRDDFELRVNSRLEPWFAGAEAHFQANRLQSITPYRFPY